MLFVLRTKLYNGRESAELWFENVFHRSFDVEELVLLFQVNFHFQNTHALCILFFNSLFPLFPLDSFSNIKSVNSSDGNLDMQRDCNTLAT